MPTYLHAEIWDGGRAIGSTDPIARSAANPKASYRIKSKETGIGCGSIDYCAGDNTL